MDQHEEMQEARISKKNLLSHDKVARIAVERAVQGVIRPQCGDHCLAQLLC